MLVFFCAFHFNSEFVKQLGLVQSLIARDLGRIGRDLDQKEEEEGRILEMKLWSYPKGINLESC